MLKTGDGSMETEGCIPKDTVILNRKGFMIQCTLASLETNASDVSVHTHVDTHTIRTQVSKRRSLNSGMNCLKTGLLARTCNLNYSEGWTGKASLNSTQRIQGHTCQLSETLSQQEKGRT